MNDSESLRSASQSAVVSTTKLAPPATRRLNRRQIWIEVERLISHVKQHYAHLGWVNMLDPWIARNTEYFIWEDHGEEPRNDLWQDLNEFFERPVQLCGLIYMHECMTELQERLSNIKRLQGSTNEIVQARVLGFLRFYDVCAYYTRLYNGERYRPLYQRLKLTELERHVDLIERTLAGMQFLPKPYIVEDFLTLTTRLFHEFNAEVLGERFYLYQEEDLLPASPLRPSRSTYDDRGVPSPMLMEVISHDQDYQLCKSFLEGDKIYERLEGNGEIARKQAIEFCLMFLLKKCWKVAQPFQRELVTNGLTIMQRPTPNIKKFWRLDPHKQTEYLEKTETFYKRIYQIYIDVVEYRRKSLVGDSRPTREFRNCLYLAHSAQNGFELRHGTITIYRSERGRQESCILIDRSQVAPALPTGETVEVVLPGFINLHTHTKYSFQGKVDFARRFNYRFEWRGEDIEGRHIISEAKLLEMLCQHNRTPAGKLALNGTGYCQADRHRFRENAKLYSQLQAVIGGTTTQFLECEYQKRPYLDMIRNTLVSDSTSKNISSNDLYVLWRNQKNKEVLAMIWSKDFIGFLQRVINLEISILRENQRDRINLHVHLAEGGSDNNITTCEFDNFCYDIICIEHFIRQVRDRLTRFGPGEITIKLDSKINENHGVSVISAQRADKTYRCELEVRKFIVRNPDTNRFSTDLSLKITEHVTTIEGSIIREMPTKVLREINWSELTQSYKLQTLRGNLLIIHANGFQWDEPLHRYLLETYETNVCISPVSNTMLYGELHRFNWRHWIESERYSRYWKHLSIGTDWNPTGAQNILEESRYLLKQFRANNIQVTPRICRTLLEMMTVNPARVIKLPAGELKDNCLADLWIGRFPAELVFPEGQFSPNSDRFVDYLLRRFDYQDHLLQVYSKGKLVYSQVKESELQQIQLRNELQRWFLNPQGYDSHEFQEGVQAVRDILTGRFQATASLLFP